MFNDLEIKYIGYIYIKWDNSIFFSELNTYFEYENPYTICDCLTKSELSENSICTDMINKKYGTYLRYGSDGVTIMNEYMKSDYYNCK